MKYRKTLFIITSLSIIIFGGCASSGSYSSNGSKSIDQNSDFIAGKIRLQCGSSCAGSWGANRATAKRLYLLENWDLLAEKVMEIGFNVDQTYYYHARSAEGKNHTEAAIKYYELALASDHKCNNIINVCDNLNIPELSKKRLQEIKNLRAATSQENAQPIISLSNKKRLNPISTSFDTLTLMLNDAIQGQKLSSRFCTDMQPLAKDLYSVKSFQILPKADNLESFDKNGDRFALYTVRIESSTRGGFAITNNWYIILGTEFTNNKETWCLRNILSDSR